MGFFSYTTISDILNRPTNLPPPPTQPTPSPVNLAQALNVATAQGESVLNKTAQVPWEDHEAFKEHLKTAAIKQGWLAYDNTRYSTHIIMPAEELHKLDDFQTNPAAWVTADWVIRESARTLNPQEPASLNLVKVNIRTNPTGTTRPAILFFLSSMGLASGAFLTFTILSALRNQLLNTRKANA